MKTCGNEKSCNKYGHDCDGSINYSIGDEMYFVGNDINRTCFYSESLTQNRRQTNFLELIAKKLGTEF